MTAEREGLVELKAAIEAGLRKCRHREAPVSLIAEHDLLHVTHMVADALAGLLAARDRRVRGEALRDAAENVRLGAPVGHETYSARQVAQYLDTRARLTEREADA